MKSEADKRYEAVLHTINGVHTMGHFDRLDDAKAWLMKRYEEYRTADRAAVIYDQHEGRKRVLVIDPNFLLAGKDYR
jgi:hypothetical protein